MLSCSCNYEPEPGETIWYGPEDYTYLDTKTNRKCSCGKIIEKGDLCSKIRRFKVPETKYESNRFGWDGEIPRASKYLCEECTDLYFSLQELGFCEMPWENQKDLVKEYVVLREENALFNI